ncbi:M23 family metallopeptidase [Sporolactobacillus sp. THM7-4]|nr:M23 family metallopeptidase [Sporolactobacillus sp. THM7-4]
MSDNNDQKKSQEKELTGLRKLAKRRWFYPALYLCVASLVLTGVLLFQIKSADQARDKEEENRVVFNQSNPSKATAGEEVFEWPAAQSNTEVTQPFYDANGTEQEQQAALVNYDQTYVQNKGINIGAKDDKAFTVTAAMSGKVTEARKDNLLGYVVTLKHQDGVESVYESLGSINVKLGESVRQGDKIGTAGTEAFNRKMGVHLHFEIRENGMPVNPVAFISKGTHEVKSFASKVEKTNAPSASEKTIEKGGKNVPGPNQPDNTGKSNMPGKSNSGTDNKGSSVDQGSLN